MAATKTKTSTGIRNFIKPYNPYAPHGAYGIYQGKVYIVHTGYVALSKSLTDISTKIVHERRDFNQNCNYLYEWNGCIYRRKDLTKQYVKLFRAKNKSEAAKALSDFRLEAIALGSDFFIGSGKVFINGVAYRPINVGYVATESEVEQYKTLANTRKVLMAKQRAFKKLFNKEYNYIKDHKKAPKELITTGMTDKEKELLGIS